MMMVLKRLSQQFSMVSCFAFLIQRPHGGGGRRDDVVDKEEESVLWSETDPLPDEEVELPHSEIGGNQVLFLIQIPNTSFGRFLYNDGDSVWVFPADLLSLSPPLLEGMFLFVLPLHVD
jgi:hypothetical protein